MPKAYFLRGEQYLRYDVEADLIDSGYPKPLATRWTGFADAGIADSRDASLNWGNGKAYFFSGGVYLRYDIETDSVDSGFPARIADLWPGFEAAGFGLHLDASWVKPVTCRPRRVGQASRKGTHR